MYPYLFISYGGTKAFYTLREAYLDVIYIDGMKTEVVRTRHVQNLSQRYHAARGRAKVIEKETGIRLNLESSTDARDLRDIVRTDAEEARAARYAKAQERNRAVERRDAEIMARGVRWKSFDFGKWAFAGVAQVAEVDRDYLEWYAAEHDTLLANYCEVVLERTQPVESQYVGELGERREFEGVVAKNFSYANEWGWKSVITVKDDDGNAIVLFTTSSFPGVGKRVRFRGTIKSHTLYKGERNTGVARPAKIEEVAA